MQNKPIITLTTDFGYGPFVGIMKGVILSINPDVNIVDISHCIRPYNIVEAAFVIAESYKYFPKKTINVVVVDPGVGTKRRPILLATDHHYFIGPDNGVFTKIYQEYDKVSVIHVNSEHYFLKDMSTTFHGRDIFAPVAGWLSRGIDITKFGDFIEDYKMLDLPEPKRLSNNIIEGEIIYVDNFGNLITNIYCDETLRNNMDNVNLIFRDDNIPIVETYANGDEKKMYSLINSFGYIELFVNLDNASKLYDVNVGERVKLIFIDRNKIVHLKYKKLDLF